jgi:hypothetical protein
MKFSTLSVAALSLAMMGGAALAEPTDSGAYRPDTAVSGSAVDTMQTGSIAAPVVREDAYNSRAQTSREGGGEPTAVDPLSPSVVGK